MQLPQAFPFGNLSASRWTTATDTRTFKKSRLDVRYSEHPISATSAGLSEEKKSFVDSEFRAARSRLRFAAARLLRRCAPHSDRGSLRAQRGNRGVQADWAEGKGESRAVITRVK